MRRLPAARPLELLLASGAACRRVAHRLSSTSTAAAGPRPVDGSARRPRSPAAPDGSQARRSPSQRWRRRRYRPWFPFVPPRGSAWAAPTSALLVLRRDWPRRHAHPRFRARDHRGQQAQFARPRRAITPPLPRLRHHLPVEQSHLARSRRLLQRAVSVPRSLTPAASAPAAATRRRCSNPTYDGNRSAAAPATACPATPSGELAYRAGTTTAYYNGALSTATATTPTSTPSAGYKDNSLGTTHPVAAKAANTAALYDMSGNVWEWCHDLWDVTPTPPRHRPIGSRPGNRTLRGGAWDSPGSAPPLPLRRPAENKAKQYVLGVRRSETRWVLVRKSQRSNRLSQGLLIFSQRFGTSQSCYTVL